MKRGFVTRAGRFVLVGVLLLLTGRTLPVQGAETEQISAEEFQDSDFAVLFQAGNYEYAIEALGPLLERYPGDPLLRRYRAMTLDLVGRSEEAIALFQELLLEDPNHVPTRYFLGQAYERAGLLEEAAGQWLWVIGNSPALEYAHWSAEALDRIYGRTAGLGLEEWPAPLPSVVAPPPAVPVAAARRWFLAGLAGWEWDSNVTLKPEEKALASVGDRNAERFSLNLRMGHHTVQRPGLAVDLFYTARQSFHDDSLDDFNFTSQEGSVDLRKRGRLGDREITWGARWDTAAGLLESDLFSLSNGLTLTADTRWTPHTRTLLTSHAAWLNFGPDGSNPPQTSRDGWYQDVGLTQYLYTSDFRRHLFFTQQYNDTRTRGGNFELRGATSRAGFRTPLGRDITLDCSVGFRWNRYPRFDSLSSTELTRRRDSIRDYYVGLTYPLKPRLASRLFYRFVDSENRNDLFEYERHLAGVQLLF